MGRATIVEDLSTVSDTSTLLGGRCRSCAATTFPAGAGCPWPPGVAAVSLLAA